MKLPLGKVLILDDSVPLTSVLKEGLDGPEMQVLIAHTAQEAFSLAEANEVGVALVDVRLQGDGDSDGINFARRLRDFNPDSRIFFFTGFDSPEVHEKVRSLGLEHIAVIRKAEQSLSDLREIVGEAVDGYNSDRAARQSESDTRAPLIQLDTIDLALYRALAAHPELLQTMDWRRFEKLLADVLETLEYEVELQQGTKDGGIDIIALRRSTEWGDHRYLLQAKRWKNRVGVEPVQRLLFLKSDLQATKCCLATTSTFTRGAWALRRDYRWELELRDFNGLREWIERALRKKLHLPERDA